MKPPQKKTKPRSIKIMLWGLLVLITSLIVCVVLISTVSWTYAKPWINRQASALANRPAAVQGALTLRWIKPTNQQGWHQWLPWPEIHAEHITLGNPWREAGNMAEIKSLTIVFNPWALLAHTIQIQRLDIQDSTFSFEQRADGTNNWTFASGGDGTPSRWAFELENITLKNVIVHAVDKVRELRLKGTLNSAQTPQPGQYGIAWTVSGTHRGAEFEGKGQFGRMLSLRQGGTPFPLQGEVRVGATTINVEGTVTKRDAATLMDLKLKLAGDSMDELFPIIGVLLPSTPPYHTEGRLIKTLLDGDDTWRYEDFKGVVGKSDVQGTLQYQRRDPRSVLTGEIESKLLRFQDLGPLIGADTSDTKRHTAHKAAHAQPPDKALPAERIDTARWGALARQLPYAPSSGR